MYPQHCLQPLPPLLWGPCALLTSPLSPQAEQVPWLWTQDICQTFSAIPELPVLPRNVGTGQGQSDSDGGMCPAGGRVETDPMCTLTQLSLLGKGASLVSQLPVHRAGAHSIWWTVGQSGRIWPLEWLPQLQGQWFGTFAFLPCAQTLCPCGYKLSNYCFFCFL